MANRPAAPRRAVGAGATARDPPLVRGAVADPSSTAGSGRPPGTTIDSFVDAPNLSLAHADLRYAYATQTSAYTWQMLTALGNSAVPSGAGFQITSPSRAILSGRAAAGGQAAQDPVFALAPKLLTNSTGDGAAQVLSATTPKQAALDS